MLLLVTYIIPLCHALQTYISACEWLELVYQMFAQTGMPLVALVGNKADSQEQQAFAAQQLPLSLEPCTAACCR